MAHKLNMFALALMTVGLLASCGSNSSQPAPTPGTVDQSVFDGEPGQFSSTYTGFCVIQTADRAYKNCSTQVIVRQSGTRLKVHTSFYTIPSSTANKSPKISGHADDTYTVSGKTLTIGADPTPVGQIGAQGFYATHGGQPYHFAWLFPMNFEYSGTFIDDSGRSVSVEGRVSRGSAIQASAHRSSNQNHSK